MLKVWCYGNRLLQTKPSADANQSTPPVPGSGRQVPMEKCGDRIEAGVGLA
jgi:hypothetical protein